LREIQIGKIFLEESLGLFVAKRDKPKTTNNQPNTRLEEQGKKTCFLSSFLRDGGWRCSAKDDRYPVLKRNVQWLLPNAEPEAFPRLARR
jgi:hypothetical protein